MRMKVAGYGGLALALPVVLWQLWQFVTPGLYENERKYALPFVASSVALFAMGAYIAYWTFPKALEFLINIGGDVTPMFSPNKYLSLITLMMLGFGLGFEFPILLVFLQTGRDRATQPAGVGAPLRHRRDRARGGRGHPQRRPLQPGWGSRSP